MNVLLWVVVVVLVVVTIQRTIGRTRASAAGHNRCSYCRSRLKLAEGKAGYADFCKKCGRQQPWATS